MSEIYYRRERKFKSDWLPTPFFPPKDLTVQASGICFTSQGLITMVSDGSGWVCPGGYPEQSEKLEETLIREIAEEACARVLDYQYLGSIRTFELTPVPAWGLPLFYQARYWVRIENDEYLPTHEMTARKDFHPDQFVDILRWNAKRTAQSFLTEAIVVEKKKTQ